VKRLLLLLVFVAAVLYLLTGVVQVLPQERAVVRRFGRVLAYKPGPGLWVGLPWGMDRVDRVAVDRVQSVAVGFRDEDAAAAMPAGQLLTGDHNLVNARATLYYKVRPEAVEEYVAQRDRVEELLGRSAEAAMGEWLAGRTVDVVLLRGKVDLGPVVAARARQAAADYGLGVEVLDARVGFLQPPEEVKDAFDDVAREQTKIATRRHQAEQEAEAKLRRARAEQIRLQQSAAAYATTQRLLAQGDAARFTERLAKYRAGVRQNPDYLRQVWEEERGKLFARLKENNQIDLLDHHLGADGLDVLTAPPLPRK
jgi:membrane protease subunit HflK